MVGLWLKLFKLENTMSADFAERAINNALEDRGLELEFRVFEVGEHLQVRFTFDGREIVSPVKPLLDAIENTTPESPLRIQLEDEGLLEETP